MASYWGVFLFPICTFTMSLDLTPMHIHHVSDDHTGVLNTTTINPLWPGKAYKLACTNGTDATTCASFGTLKCFEPEPDTQQVLNSFLTNCPGCLYVDIGCNVGYFAAHAAQLGAVVDCYEPTPSFTEAAKFTRELNNAQKTWQIHTMAVLPDGDNRSNITFKRAYTACNTALGMAQKEWQVPTISIRQILAGKRVELLKIDIDSVEGAMLHTVAMMIANKETQIETIIVELGDNNGPTAWDCRPGCKPSSDHPRGGAVQDLWDLQKQHGYDLYRVNVHTGREIFDWRGYDMNPRKVPQALGLQSLYSIRNMRKLEKILPSVPLKNYKTFVRWGTSFLITRVALSEVTLHHEWDLEQAGIKESDLNSDNPTMQRK